MDATEVDRAIREILVRDGRLFADANTLRDDQDLFRAGMTSLANVAVMLALEERFDVEFPDKMLGRSTFGCLSSIRAAVLGLISEKGESGAGPQGGAGSLPSSLR